MALYEEEFTSDTMSKVYAALKRANLFDHEITDAVDQLQRAGILFRERVVKVGKSVRRNTD